MKQKIIEQLQTIMDPEIPLDIYTLGLIYDIQIKSDTHLYLQITYTTPQCPFGAVMQQQIQQKMRDLGFSQVEIDVTFDPPWNASEELRDMLGV
ncbi:MAG: DUF59 domain-containing protein [Candidatus Magasanikbacteria bacterium]|uniref:Aromatic ring hydroxylase n=1 Tax=Candidatus Magasanikbacteria bacterium CG10_big_fil_rev_8_21_14_0_10_38_6 TaxID=1974647 RepID=A0A2M6P195_9BACT|nr:DUF59 domain-containing protein [Candidatus Magasanikbacteria bacterium]NCS72232.1 DUF59 domain-containing protein [Candidatus Magasanikbacteria bacterium]PIR77481.1 MAG: aromatic ring hydroxylase [Candidatus Magasanikbacteria bacterium CG10_big_fil_rev_8_21_14_0_10_38_6]